MNDSVKKINRQMAKGSAWMGLFKIVEKSLSIISTIILARLLAPEDFGLIALAMMVIAFLELMRAFGFDMALIQNQDATPQHYNTAWTFNIIAAGLIALALYFLTPAASAFYEDDRLSSIIPLLALGIIASGFENIGVVAFRKELTFHKEFLYLLSKKVISFTTAISLAFYFQNYWALVWAFVVTKISVVVVSYLVHHYRPRLSLSKAKELFSFSGWLFINNILIFLNQKAPEMIIGKTVGIESLGSFVISRDIAKAASTELVAPINRATFPGYSKLSNKLYDLKDSFLNTQGLIAILIIPASFGFAAITPVMVPTLLGEQWLETTSFMHIIAFSSLIIGINSIQPVYIALGKPRLVAKLALVRIVILIPLILLLSHNFSTVGAAWALLTTSFIMLPFNYFPIMKMINISTYELLTKIIRPLIASGIMYFVLEYVLHSDIMNEASAYSLIDLAILIIIGALTYPALLLTFWLIAGKPDGSEKQIIQTIRKKLSK